MRILLQFFHRAWVIGGEDDPAFPFQTTDLRNITMAHLYMYAFFSEISDQIEGVIGPGYGAAVM